MINHHSPLTTPYFRLFPWERGQFGWLSTMKLCQWHFTTLGYSLKAHLLGNVIFKKHVHIIHIHDMLMHANSLETNTTVDQFSLQVKGIEVKLSFFSKPHFHCKNSSDNTLESERKTIFVCLGWNPKQKPHPKTLFLKKIGQRGQRFSKDACNEKVMGKKDDMKGLKLTDLRIVYIFKYIYIYIHIQFWVWLPPSNIDHQDFCMLTRRFQPKTCIRHWNPGQGGTPNTSYVYHLNPRSKPNGWNFPPVPPFFGLPAVRFRRVFLGA